MAVWFSGLQGVTRLARAIREAHAARVRNAVAAFYAGASFVEAALRFGLTVGEVEEGVRQQPRGAYV